MCLKSCTRNSGMPARIRAASHLKKNELKGFRIWGLRKTYSQFSSYSLCVLAFIKVSIAPNDKGMCLILLDLFLEIFQERCTQSMSVHLASSTSRLRAPV